MMSTFKEQKIDFCINYYHGEGFEYDSKDCVLKDVLLNDYGIDIKSLETQLLSKIVIMEAGQFKLFTFGELLFSLKYSF